MWHKWAYLDILCHIWGLDINALWTFQFGVGEARLKLASRGQIRDMGRIFFGRKRVPSIEFYFGVWKVRMPARRLVLRLEKLSKI
jgi:hypothetical protein